MPTFRLDRFLTIYLFHPLRKKEAPDDKKIPILMYHSISDDKESASHPYYHINTSPAVFAGQMRFLAENNYTVIDLKDVQNLTPLPSYNSPPPARGRGRGGGNYAVITFDDGYRDFYTSAFPILEKYHFPATVFLPTDCIHDNCKIFKGKECLTWSEVRELHNKGVSFGSHTVTHPELYNLSWKMISQELSDSRRRVEDELQITVNIFCYPYAFPQEDRAFVLRFKQELADQGYRYAVNTVIGRAGNESDLLSLPRLPINQDDDEKLFAAKLTGAYDWMAVAQALVRRIKFHLRRARPDNL